jgi:hydrogenase maturation protease
MNSVLVAGIGNLFKGDDGFGVAVAGRLAGSALPTGVEVVDFGIRALDLVYALQDGYHAAILVDTVQRGAPPGTLYVIEPELVAPGPSDANEALLSPHEINPEKVLRIASLLGGVCDRVILVGCEPESFGDDEFGAEGLSPAVAAAVDRAVAEVERLARAFLEEVN